MKSLPMSEKIAIIGGSGYIGTRLSEYLITKNFKVTNFDINPPKNSFDIEYIKIDLLEVKDLDIQSFEHIVLLAANSSVKQAASDPPGTIRTNIAGVQSLLSVMGENQRLYFASSGSVYDGVKAISAREETNLSTPRNLYDLSKRVGEDIIGMSGKKTVIFRFGTVNGPSQNMRKDLIINAMVTSAVTKKRIHLANAQVNRAILSIDDLCSGVEKAIVSAQKASSQEIYNLASFNMTVGEIGQYISEYFNVPIVQEPASSTYDFSMDYRKAEKFIGFNPIDNLETIVRKIERGFLH